MAATYRNSKIIYKALKEIFPSSIRLTDLAAICKCSPQKAWDNLEYLVNRNLVKKTRWGQYCFIREE